MSLPLGARGWVLGIPAGLPRRRASFGNAWLPPRGSEVSLQPQSGLARDREEPAGLWSATTPDPTLVSRLETCCPLHAKQFDSFNQDASEDISSHGLCPFRGITLILPTNLKTMFLSHATAGLWSPRQVSAFDTKGKGHSGKETEQAQKSKTQESKLLGLKPPRVIGWGCSHFTGM